MAIFEYRAMTAAGREMTGTIEAAGNGQAIEQLTKMELKVNELQLQKTEKTTGAIGRNEFMLFNQQLASITKSGLPIHESLKQLSKDAASSKLRSLIERIVADMEKGLGLEDAVEKHKKAFPPLYSKILSAGIGSGRLSEMLTCLNTHVEITNRTRRLIAEAVMYPGIVLLLAVGIFGVMFKFVIPSFSEVLGDLGNGARLPYLTQLMLDISRHADIILAGVAVSIAAIVFLWFLMSSTSASRRLRESIVGMMPAIGRLCYYSSLARFSKAVALLVSANTPLADCFRLAGETSGSEKIIYEANYIAGQIEEGNGIMEAGMSCKTIPMMMLYSIQTGSQRNQLRDNLESTSEMYVEHSKSMQCRFQAMLFPFLIVVLGIFVGFTVVSMFLPMVSIVSALT